MLSIQEYFKNPALSQSRIKAFIFNSGRVKEEDIENELYYEEKTHFVIGSAIDVLLTQPESFEDLYYVDQLETKPSDKIMSIVQEYRNYINNDLDDHDVAILKACDNHAYQIKWKAATRVEKILKEGSDYLAHLEEAGDKQVLSKEEYDLIMQSALSLQTHENTSKYFNGMLEQRYQEPIYFTYRNKPCKALLDLIIVDHKNKTVLPIDIKSTGDYPENFNRGAKRFRYDIQAAWYTLALEIEYPDYKILPFKFIVVSIKDTANPLVYTCTDTDLSIGRYGARVYSDVELHQTLTLEMGTFAKVIKGFEDGISYYLAQEASGLDYPWDLKQFPERDLSLWTE